LPEFEDLVVEVLANNPILKAVQSQVDASESSVAAAEKAEGPVLRGEASASWWSRVTSSRNPLAAGLVLELPLYTGGVRDAKLAAARSNLRESRARLAQTQLDLRQSVLDLWLELDTLRVRMEEVNALGDYRELYLDRSRALYELEVRTDLGDAMVQTSAVQLQRAETVFDWSMAQARLAALAGRLIENETASEVREEQAP
jgi:outer membrane protein TolC